MAFGPKTIFMKKFDMLEDAFQHFLDNVYPMRYP